MTVAIPLLSLAEYLAYDDGLYEEIVYRGDEVIKSFLFPELKLTSSQIFNI